MKAEKRIPFVMTIDEAKHITAPIPARYFAQLNVDRTLEPRLLAVVPHMVPISVSVGNILTSLAPAGDQMQFDAGIIASPGHIVRAWFTRRPEKVMLIAVERKP